MHRYICKLVLYSQRHIADFTNKFELELVSKQTQSNRVCCFRNIYVLCWQSAFITALCLNLDGRRGTNNTFLTFTVFCFPEGISKFHSCLFFDVVFPSFLLSSSLCSCHRPLQNRLRNAWQSRDVVIPSEFLLVVLVTCKRSSCTPSWILLRTSSSVTWSLREMFRSLR